jgi:hypothetical protein
MSSHIRTRKLWNQCGHPIFGRRMQLVELT